MLGFAIVATANKSIVAEVDAIIANATNRRDGFNELLTGPDSLSPEARADATRKLHLAESYLAKLKHARQLYDFDDGVVQSSGRRPGAFARICYALAIVGFPASLGFYFGGRLPAGTPPLLTNFSDQLTLLAFLVALAAYLQTVVRGLKTALKYSRNEREGHWLDFALVLIAETAIVFVGVAATIRVVGVPLRLSALQGYTQAQTDLAIVAGFAGCVLFLAGLHARQWWLARKM